MLFGFGWDLVYNTFLILIHSSILLLTLSLYSFNPSNRFQLIVNNIHLNYPIFFSCLQIPHFSFFFFFDPFIWVSFFFSLWSIYFLIIFSSSSVFHLLSFCFVLILCLISSSFSSSPSIFPLMLYILLILYLHVFFFRFSSLLLFISSSFFLDLFFSFCGSPLHPVYLFFFFSFLFPLAPFCLLSLGVCLDFFFFFLAYSIGLAVLFVLLLLLFASFMPFSFFHYSIFCFLIIFPSFHLTFFYLLFSLLPYFLCSSFFFFFLFSSC